MALSEKGLAGLTLSQDYGLASFPLRVGGKKPLIKKDDGGNGCLGATCHPEQIAAWWDRTPDANIGVVPGSAGYIVVDIDGVKGEEMVRSLGAFDVPTAEVKTRRGRHLWFRLPHGVEVGNSAHPELDVRAHAGYVLAPPSVVDGHRYTWTRTLEEVQDCPARLLAAILERSVTTVGPAPIEEATPEIANTVFTAYVARAKRDGVQSDQLAQRLDIRIKRYVTKVGYRREGEGEGRDNGAIQLARFLRVDLALNESVALDYMIEWNGHNNPPLPHRIIQDKVARALRGARRQVGCGL